MASIDHTTAPIELREKLSFTKLMIRTIVGEIKKQSGILGVVLLCTCNRTEIYLSSERNNIDPVQILCGKADINDGTIMNMFVIKKDEAATHHLMEVACGLRSMILGEDQIISQVKDAAVLAREEKVIDPVLETLFRLCVTAGKKVRSQVRIKAVSTSVAQQAVKLLSEHIGELNDIKALVIGNGEIGRLCAEKLVEAGCSVTMTLRTYKHGQTIIPDGCETIEYDKRSISLSSVDVVFSATTSPHHTLTYDMLSQLKTKPSYIFDLAVPRDVDPQIEKINEIICFNIDTIGKTAPVDNSQEIKLANALIDEYAQRFFHWIDYRKSPHVIKKAEKPDFERVRRG
jgi:glutamyl-tRNA reductase